jgi:hypothetical protein
MMLALWVLGVECYQWYYTLPEDMIYNPLAKYNLYNVEHAVTSNLPPAQVLDAIHEYGRLYEARGNESVDTLVHNETLTIPFQVFNGHFTVHPSRTPNSTPLVKSLTGLIVKPGTTLPFSEHAMQMYHHVLSSPRVEPVYLFATEPHAETARATLLCGILVAVNCTITNAKEGSDKLRHVTLNPAAGPIPIFNFKLAKAVYHKGSLLWKTDTPPITVQLCPIDANSSGYRIPSDRTVSASIAAWNTYTQSVRFVTNICTVYNSPPFSKYAKPVAASGLDHGSRTNTKLTDFLYTFKSDFIYKSVFPAMGAEFGALNLLNNLPAIINTLVDESIDQLASRRMHIHYACPATFTFKPCKDEEDSPGATTRRKDFMANAAAFAKSKSTPLTINSTSREIYEHLHIPLLLLWFCQKTLCPCGSDTGIGSTLTVDNIRAVLEDGGYPTNSNAAGNAFQQNISAPKFITAWINSLSRSQL